MSLFSEYIIERGLKHIVESEQGFATYIITGPECYVEDVYVAKEARKKGEASFLVDNIVKHAKTLGCTTLLTSVVPSARGSTESTTAILAYGFSLLRAQPDFIVFKKDI